jgi:transposase-like protein
MRSIPEVVPITLTELERAELEGLARLMNGEHRLCQRARIVLLASDGAPTRQIARTVACTIGTASKWRARSQAHGRFRREGRKGGAEPKYGRRTTPASWRCSTRAAATFMSNMSGISCARKRSIFPAANHGARATISTSWPRPPKSSASTWQRPPKLTDDDVEAAKALLANPDIGVTQIAHRLGVSPATLYRYIPAARTANTPGG